MGGSRRGAQPLHRVVLVGRVAYRVLRALPPGVTLRAADLAARSPRLRSLMRRATAPMRTGPHEIAAGPARGLVIDVAGSRPTYSLGTAERDVVAFLTREIAPGCTVFDLGANVGYISLCAAALTGRSGLVVAVEPAAANARALRRNVELNALLHVEVVEAAVAESAGRAQLSVADSDQDASLVRRGAGPVVEVDAVTIDMLTARFGAPQVIKVDIEGAEATAFHGAEATLRDARPVILCEVHIGIPDLTSAVPAFLAARGYRVSWLEPGAVDGTAFWAPHLVAIPMD
jgi:FkbM family methyltransferase